MCAKRNDILSQPPTSPSVAGKSARTATLSDAELRAGHRARLRKRFLQDPSALPDYEILELLLGYIYLRRDNKLLAKRILAHFGSIGDFLAASDAERQLVDGCGEPVDAACALIREIIARSAQSAVQKKQSLDIYDVLHLGIERLRLCSDEEVWAILLDKRNRLLTYSKVRHGCFDRVALDPLELVQLMLKHKANALVLMHNHPGGSFRPSLSDRELTGRIDAALKHLGLHLHDHLIITPESCFSIKLDRSLDIERP